MTDATDQLEYLVRDLSKAVNGRWYRWLSVPLAEGSLSIIGYRFSRSCYLALGRKWEILHTLLTPLRLLTRPFGAHLEIHYKADIGPGLMVLHPTLGVVVSGKARVGRDLVLTGGNTIGGRAGMADRGGLFIGDGVTLGANAVILGPASVGDGVVVGAGSVVVGDAPDGAVMVGAPARALVQSGAATPA